MKKWKMGALIVVISFLLSACGPSDEAQPFIKKGDAAFQNEDYDKAIEQFAKAYNTDNHNDIFDKLQAARTKKLEILTKKYNEEKKLSYYKEALATLDEMMKFKGLIDEDVLEEYEEERKDFQFKAEDQARLDDYILWVGPYVTELKSIANTWFTVSRGIELGGTTRSQSASDVSKLILRNQKILGEIDTKTMNVYPALTETHIILYDIVLNNDKALTAALAALKDQRPASEVTEAGLKVTESHGDIANFTNKIRNYATELELRDTFEEIVFKSTENSTSSQEDTNDDKK